MIHRLLHAAIAPLVVLAAANAARSVEPDESELLSTAKGLTYRHWLPKNFGRRRKVPLILFSHGFGGCAQQSASLTRALADAGYAVFAPNHRDEGCERYLRNMRAALGAGALQPEQPFTQPAAWGPMTELGRRDDMEALLDHVLTQSSTKDAVDPGRVGLMGHSLGGYTALALGGAWPNWRDPRFKAVLALSPYVTPFLTKDVLGEIGVPVMYQTGTRDIAIAPALTRGGFAKTPKPKYLLVLEGAAHFAWTELHRAYQETIAAYATAFFDRELRKRPAPLLDQKPGLQVARYLRETG